LRGDFVRRTLYYERDFAEEVTGREVDEVRMEWTRRKVCCLVPALAAAGTDLGGFAAQDNSLPSAAYPFENMPVENSDRAQIRKIVKGRLATGEQIEAHETTLPMNGYPHPPHHHLHSEMWLIREGTVELTINGTTHRLGAGGVGFVHSNEEHGIKNVGTGPATYYVVAIGPGADS
jgi:mannose-6-phosphate isomerase-like protein (cupin superfamily)